MILMGMTILCKSQQNVGPVHPSALGIGVLSLPLNGTSAGVSGCRRWFSVALVALVKFRPTWGGLPTWLGPVREHIELHHVSWSGLCLVFGPWGGV